MAAEEAGKRSTGIVKWFSAQRGFGFIAPDESGEDLFVHQTSIRSDGFRTLSEGQSVEFSVDLGEDGGAKVVEVVALSRSRRVGRGGGGRSGGTYFVRGRGGARGERSGYGGRSGRGGRYGGRGWDGSSDGVCYNCGRIGHFARNCYQGSGPDGGDGSRGKRRYGGGRGRGTCFNCREEGHFARDCPNNAQN